MSFLNHMIATLPDGRHCGEAAFAVAMVLIGQDMASDGHEALKGMLHEYAALSMSAIGPMGEVVGHAVTSQPAESCEKV